MRRLVEVIAMGNAGDARDGAAPRPEPDRRAEALRANLKRRKAQTRARDDAQRIAPRTEGLGQNG